jgi:hypothetical protein
MSATRRVGRGPGLTSAWRFACARSSHTPRYRRHTFSMSGWHGRGRPAAPAVASTGSSRSVKTDQLNLDQRPGRG